MPLIHVTGLSGTGKSTVLSALRARGLQAYGVDEDLFAEWVRRDTGEVGSRHGQVDIHAWIKDHDWTLSRARIRALRDAAEGGRRAHLPVG